MLDVEVTCPVRSPFTEGDELLLVASSSAQGRLPVSLSGKTRNPREANDG